MIKCGIVSRTCHLKSLNIRFTCCMRIVVMVECTHFFEDEPKTHFDTFEKPNVSPHPRTLKEAKTCISIFCHSKVDKM